jgi:DNA/RNA endonuclease YhcR with UshA esterase domain
LTVGIRSGRPNALALKKGACQATLERLSATVSGGKAPYTYSINFTPPLNLAPPVTTKASADGRINEEITVPGDLAKDQETEYAIVVKDADGKSETFKGDRKTSLKVASAASPKEEPKEAPKVLPKQASK